MGLRDRRRERREDRCGSGRPSYRMREKAGPDRRRLPDRDAQDHPVAMVKNAMISPLRDRHEVQLADGGELEGDIVDSLSHDVA